MPKKLDIFINTKNLTPNYDLKKKKNSNQFQLLVTCQSDFNLSSI